MTENYKPVVFCKHEKVALIVFGLFLQLVVGNPPYLSHQKKNNHENYSKQCGTAFLPLFIHHRAFFLSTAFKKEDTGIRAAYGLIERVTPGYSKQFVLELIPAGKDGQDVYEIDGKKGKVILRGNNPVSLATAYNQYLKYTCGAHVSWFGDQLKLPKSLPAPVASQKGNNRLSTASTGCI